MRLLARWSVLFLLVAAGCARGAAPAGDWIWCQGTASASPNAYAYFRKPFTLSGSVQSGSVTVAADTRYILYVNGQRVGRGSARHYTAHKFYDTWNIGPYLQSGQNLIAVLVHYLGASTLLNQMGKAGLLLDATATSSGGSVTVRSDATWKAQISTAWDRTQHRMGNGLDYAEAFDARQEPVGWNTATFDDSAWPLAIRIGPAGVAPWIHLTPADIPTQREVLVRPQKVVYVQRMRPAPPVYSMDLNALYRDSRTNIVAYASTWVYVPETVSLTLRVANDSANMAWVNGNWALLQQYARTTVPLMKSYTFTAPAGWSRVLLKSVRYTAAWQMQVGFEGPGAEHAVVSAAKDPSQPGTWRLSPLYTYATRWFDGYATRYEPETNPSDDAWNQITVPCARVVSPATAHRFATRDRPQVPLVTNAASLLSESGSAVFQSSTTGDGSLVLDMGREVFGYPIVQVAGAQGGEGLDLVYGEALQDADAMFISPKATTDGVVNAERDNIWQMDRFTCRAGANRFEPFEKKAFRYIQIDVRSMDHPLTVTSVAVNTSMYPVNERGSFACSDDVLNRIWTIGQYTAQLNMDDAYTDCPWRERGQWWGDARVIALTNYYAFGDAALTRHGIVQGALSQCADGVLQGYFPTDNDNRMPSYTLAWVYSIWEYVLYTGDITICAQMLPTIDRVVAFMDKYTNAARGLLEDVPYWVYIDWGGGLDYMNNGASGPLNCMYYYALCCSAKVALAANDCVAATRYLRKAEALRKAINQYMWNPAENYYHDVLVGGVGTAAASQHMNALAIAFGVAPEERWPAIVNRMYSAPAMTRPGPFFTSYVLEALQAADDSPRALDVIRTMWGPMVDWGSSTTWESLNPVASLAHGFSSGPTRYLPSAILGLHPTSAGWATWEMRPSWGDLSWARGVAPTPHGDISADWTREASGLTLHVTVPEGTSGRVSVPTAGMEGWHWEIQRSDNPPSGVLPDGVTLEPAGASWGAALTRPGAYTVTARPAGQ